MKILLVAQNYHPFVGGVETHARQTAQAFHRMGHGIEVAASNFSQQKPPTRLVPLRESLLIAPFSDYNDEGVPVHALTPSQGDRVKMLPIALRIVPKVQRFAYHPLHAFGYPWFKNVFYRRIRRIIETQKTEVVHSLANGYLGWTAQRAAHDCGLPFINTPFVHPHQWGDGPNDTAYYKRCDGIIGLVETDRDYLVSLGIEREKTHVIGVSPDLPSSVNPSAFRERHSLGDSLVVLYVGRMMPQKGANALLAACPAILKAVPNAKILFIGPASEAEAAAFKTAPEGVRYLGKVSLQDKADALAACDLFCMPSLSEILPTVYLEAWSYARPVVGGMAHGLLELVTGNGAGINAPQEPNEIADKIIALLNSPAERARLGANGKRLVEEHYSVPAVTELLLALYQSVIAQKKGITA